MNRKLSESDAAQLGEWIEKRNYAELEKWIEADPDQSQERAKWVFSHYSSMRALEEVDAVIRPPDSEKVEFRAAASKVAEAKRVVIACLERGLEILIGEEYHRPPELGFTRSVQGGDALDFGKFTISHSRHTQEKDSHNEKSPYELKLGKCERVTLEEVGQEVRGIYQGKKIRGFALGLDPGKYRIAVDGESWEIELQ